MKNLPHFLLWNLKLAKPWTWYTERECETLARYAKGKKRLAEIGCWQGFNTRRLRAVMAEDGILYAVDPYFKGRLGFSAAQVIAHREVSKIRRGTMEWLRMTDLEAADCFRKSGQPPLDFIFGDAVNTYEGFKACWKSWSPLLQVGGIYILGTSHATQRMRIGHTGSVRYTQEILSSDNCFKHLETVESMTVLQKIKGE